MGSNGHGDNFPGEGSNNNPGNHDHDSSTNYEAILVTSPSVIFYGEYTSVVSFKQCKFSGVEITLWSEENVFDFADCEMENVTIFIVGSSCISIHESILRNTKFCGYEDEDFTLEKFEAGGTFTAGDCGFHLAGNTFENVSVVGFDVEEWDAKTESLHESSMTFQPENGSTHLEFSHSKFIGNISTDEEEDTDEDFEDND